uniref:hypothetical protein n=1 Tax=Acetatifactor sp. TaxID=1872090 RepID=UPI0040565248
MNRFEQTRKPLSRSLTYLYPLVAFGTLLILFLGGIRSVSETSYAKQQESLETALTRSISQCYAVEGVYPPSLDYLIAHYGLTYDEEEFLVDYEYYGGNLLPEITVLRKQH